MTKRAFRSCLQGRVVEVESSVAGFEVSVGARAFLPYVRDATSIGTRKRKSRYPLSNMKCILYKRKGGHAEAYVKSKQGRICYINVCFSVSGFSLVQGICFPRVHMHNH
jgi:hypothetical protein